MKNLEKRLKNNILDRIRGFGIDAFKKSNKHVWEAVLQTLDEVNLKNVKENYLILMKGEISKLKLKLDKPKVFIFCGVFQRGGEPIILLENIDTNGTYYMNDNKIIKQVRDYKLGSRIGIEKTVKGVNLVLPDYFHSQGLFD